MEKLLITYKEYLIEKGKRENTVNAYATDVTLYRKYLKEKKMEFKEVKSDEIMNYIQHLIASGKSERSINRIIISLRNFYNFLKEKQYIMEVPTIQYKSQNKIKKLPQILSVEEIEKIINSIDGDNVKGIRDKALLEVMYATGMKVSELISIRMEDINIDLAYVKCRDYKNFERVIPMGQKAIKALRNYFWEREKINYYSEEYLFLNLNGHKLTRQGVWRIVKEYCSKANIKKDVNLNTFRHSFAVHLLQNGANARAVQKLLGNQVLTYMDTYYEIINSDKLNIIYKNFHPRA